MDDLEEQAFQEELAEAKRNAIKKQYEKLKKSKEPVDPEKTNPITSRRGIDNDTDFDTDFDTDEETKDYNPIILPLSPYSHDQHDRAESDRTHQQKMKANQSFYGDLQNDMQRVKKEQMFAQIGANLKSAQKQLDAKNYVSSMSQTESNLDIGTQTEPLMPFGGGYIESQLPVQRVPVMRARRGDFSEFGAPLFQPPTISLKQKRQPPKKRKPKAKKKKVAGCKEKLEKAGYKVVKKKK